MIANKELIKEYTIFSNNVKYYRKKCHLNQEGLAEIADLSISYIKQIESENEFKNVSLNTMLKLSKALDINIKNLFE